MTLRLARRTLLAAFLVAPLGAPLAAKSAAAADPSGPVAALNAGLLAIMKAAKTKSFTERAALLKPVVESAFDLPRILRNSVGPRFGSFDEATRAKLLDVFTQFTVASYVANFDGFSGERFEIVAGTRTVGSDQVVATRLVLPDGDPVKLDYQVHDENGSWKIVDVLMDGSISRVAVQRSDFRALLGSGDATRLIDSLSEKVTKLTAGNAAG